MIGTLRLYIFLGFLCLQFAIAKSDGLENGIPTSNDGSTKSDISNQSKIQQAQYLQIPPPSSLFQTQPTKLRQDFSTLPVVVNADRISRLLRKLANEDMGVYAMQVTLFFH